MIQPGVEQAERRNDGQGHKRKGDEGVDATTNAHLMRLMLNAGYTINTDFDCKSHDINLGIGYVF